MINISHGRFTIEFKQWTAKRELVNYIQHYADTQLLLGDDDLDAANFCSFKASTELLEATTIGVGVCSKDAGLSSQIMFQGHDRMVIGFNSQVVGVSLSMGNLLFSVDLPFLFFAFSFVEEQNLLLAFCELGVVGISPYGDEVWCYRSSDVLTDWKLEDAVLKLTFMDEEAVFLSVADGTKV